MRQISINVLLRPLFLNKLNESNYLSQDIPGSCSLFLIQFKSLFVGGKCYLGCRVFMLAAVLRAITNWSILIFISWPFLLTWTISTYPYPPCLQGRLIGLIRVLSQLGYYKSLTWHDMKEKQREIWGGRKADLLALQQILQCQSQHTFHVDGRVFLILPLLEAAEEIRSLHKYINACR